MPEFAEAGVLVSGTPDIEIIEELKPAPGEVVIEKNRPSAFYATNIKPI
jgi:ureidoacrylate peracid hydrolase